MSLREQLFGSNTDTDSDADTQEQLAEGNPYDDIDPKGKRSSGGFFASYLDPILGRDETSRTYSSHQGVDVSVPPKHLTTRYNEYIQTEPLVKGALTIFNDSVTEPGWMVDAEIDDETDEEMQEALELWGKNCAVHAHEPGNDIETLIEQIPEKRRGKGTIYIEKAAARGDENSLGGLLFLPPETVKVYSRENQPILIQPTDTVPPDHPRTESGEAAAYVQYDEKLDGYEDKDPIAFSANDVLKIVYDPAEGAAHGTPMWVTIREHIDRLNQLLSDRGASIRINGHPWRTISNEHWSYKEAEKFLSAHFSGDISTWQESTTKDQDTFAGRMDAIPHNIEVDEHTGSIPDIDDAIMDEVQQIFSILPVSRYLIAYEEGINQFVVEPQERKDERNAVKERHIIREYIEPVFEQKGDELAGGEYEGTITWKIEQPADENPLERESFDADDWATMVEPFLDAGAPLELAYWSAGVDQEQFEYADDEVAPLDEADEDVQARAEEMGISLGMNDANVPDEDNDPPTE